MHITNALRSVPPKVLASMAIVGDEDAKKEMFRRKLNQMLGHMVAKNRKAFSPIVRLDAIVDKSAVSARQQCGEKRNA